MKSRVLRAAAAEAKRRRTPFYLFDPSDLSRQAAAWLEAVSRAAPAALFYPYKCNRSEVVARHLARRQLGAEIATLTDFGLAWQLGLRGDRIVVQGPAKSRHLIDIAIASGALLVADSPEDAEAIRARGRALRKPPRYLLRIAVRAAEEEQRGFGLEPREAVALAREGRRKAWPPPEGLAFHLGTGIPDVAPYEHAIREAAGVARGLRSLGIPTSVLDLGGGFASEVESRRDARGRPRRRGLPASRVVPPLARLARRLLGPDVRLHFQPGRALVSGSIQLVSRAVRVRETSRGTRVYLDASRLAHAFFVARGVHPIAVLPTRRGAPRRFALAGRLGVGLDVFADPVRLPPVRPDDLVVIGAVGAYNVNAANAWAGPIPPVVTMRTD